MLRQFVLLLINNGKLTYVVVWLYKHANVKSSRRTSQGCVNHFQKFTEKYFGSSLNPIPQKSMSLKY